MMRADNEGMNKLALALISVALISVGSRADEKQSAEPQNPRSYVNALIGGAVVTSTGGGSGLTYSGRVGTAVYEDRSAALSIGVFVNSWANSQTTSGVTVDGRLTALMAELIARRAFGTGLYYGGRAGFAISGATVTSGNTSVSASGTSFAFAPVVGVELPATSRLSANADISWLNRTGLTMTFPSGTAIKLDSAAAMLFQAGIAYSF